MSTSNSRAGGRVLDRQVRHADRLLQKRRLRAARDHAGLRRRRHRRRSRGGRCRGPASRSRRSSAGTRSPSARAARRRRRSRPSSSRRSSSGRLRARVVVSSMSLPCRRIARLEPQRVARAETARNDVRQPCRPRAAPATRGPPTAAARRFRSRPRRYSRCGRSSRARWRLRRARTSSTSIAPSSTPVSGCRMLERLRPLNRQQRIARARVDGDRVARRLDLLGDPGVVLRDVAGVDDQQEMRRARGGRRAGRRRRCLPASAGRNTAPGPPASFDASLDEMRCTAASASLPAISISPMWLTSNSPARSRTRHVLVRRCRSTRPAYPSRRTAPSSRRTRDAGR